MTTMNRMSEVESLAVEIVRERFQFDDRVAGTLANEIVNERIEVADVIGVNIEAGIQAAIDEIDDGTFAFAVDAISGRVAEEIERQAKAIALRMLRETAAKAERAAEACSPAGGI